MVKIFLMKTIMMSLTILIHGVQMQNLIILGIMVVIG